MIFFSRKDLRRDINALELEFRDMADLHSPIIYDVN